MHLFSRFRNLSKQKLAWLLLISLFIILNVLSKKKKCYTLYLTFVCIYDFVFSFSFKVLTFFFNQ